MTGTVGQVAFSNDGRYLGIGSTMGGWWTLVKPRGRTDSLPAYDIQRLVCSQVERNSAFSAEEWQRYFGAGVPLRYTCASLARLLELFRQSAPTGDSKIGA